MTKTTSSWYLVLVVGVIAACWMFLGPILESYLLKFDGGCEAVCVERICIVNCSSVPLLFCNNVIKFSFTHAVFARKHFCLTVIEWGTVILDEYFQWNGNYPEDTKKLLNYYPAFEMWPYFSLDAVAFHEEMAIVRSFTTNALKESEETRVMFDTQDLAIPVIMYLLEIDRDAACEMLILEGERSWVFTKDNKKTHLY